MTASSQTAQNGNLKIGELPELHMVGLDDVVLHEDPDMERVARLIDRFSAEGVLKNPPVVGRSPGRRRIVLDGANRVTALRELGYLHVLVQELDLSDPGLTLGTWHHAIEHLGAGELLDNAGSVAGTRLEETALPPETEPGLARFHFRDGRVVTVQGADDLEGRVAQLHQVTRIYHRFAHFDRVSYTDLKDLTRHYPDFTALLVFRPFTLDDLQQLTQRDVRVPSGVTRILLPKRALRFNLQLEMLRAGLSVEQKEEWLQQAILEKVAGKAIRFYREPTFFFDE